MKQTANKHSTIVTRHQSTYLRKGLKHFCLISLTMTNIMLSALVFGLGYVTALYKLSILLLLLLLLVHRYTTD